MTKHTTLSRQFLGLLIACFFFGQVASLFAQESIYEVANEINQTMPQRISKEHIITSVHPRSDKELAYLIVNVVYSADQIDFNAFHNQAYDWSRNSLCSTPSSKKLIEMGYIFTYVLHGKNGKRIGEISIDSCPQ